MYKHSIIFLFSASNLQLLRNALVNNQLNCQQHTVISFIYTFLFLKKVHFKLPFLVKLVLDGYTIQHTASEIATYTFIVSINNYL